MVKMRAREEAEDMEVVGRAILPCIRRTLSPPDCGTSGSSTPVPANPLIRLPLVRGSPVGEMGVGSLPLPP